MMGGHTERRLGWSVGHTETAALVRASAGSIAPLAIRDVSGPPSALEVKTKLRGEVRNSRQ